VARIRDIVFDSERPSALARFWAAALDGYRVRPYDDAEVERLAAKGLTPETDPEVAADGPGPTLWFQQVAERKKARNRVHLDLAAGDRRGEVERLRALGASIRRERESFTVMQDPEGNEFCVVEPA
jgi:hypothetical protein